MQKLTFLIGLVMCCAVQLAAQHQTDRERFQYLGPVKSAQTVKYQLQEREGKMIPGPPVLERAETFDARGFMTSQAYHQAGNTALVKDEWKNSYNSQGQLMSREAGLADLSVKCLEEYRYDSLGRLIETQRRYNYAQPMLVTVAYSYDEAGRRLTETTRTAGSRLTVIYYKYDEQGRLISVQSANNSSQRRTVYSYDPGNLKTTLFMDNAGKEYAKWVERYDERGNLLEGTYYSAKGLWKKSQLEYEFDARGNWTIAHIRREIHDEGPMRLEHEIQQRELTYY